MNVMAIVDAVAVGILGGFVLSGIVLLLSLIHDPD
jgi:hypothetical protein